MPHSEDPPDEELVTGGASRPVVRIVVLLLVVLSAALVGYAVTRRHPDSRAAASPTAQPTRPASPTPATPSPVDAHVVFVPGLSTGASITGDRIWVTAELVNISGTDVTVTYPLRLSGASDASVTALGAELAAKNAVVAGANLPPRLTHIAAGQRVALWIGLRTHCGQGPDRSRWPTDRSRIVIPLTGSAASARFDLSVLLGRQWLPNGGRLCVWRQHS